MQKYLILVLIISGCSSTQVKKERLNVLGHGAWQGKIEQLTTKELPDENVSKVYDIIILACNSEVEFWLKNDDNGFHKIYSNYTVESLSGNSIFNIIYDNDNDNDNDNGNWVETQSWSIVFIDSNHASLQWNRMVSNRSLENSAELRSFGQLGYGSLTKVNNTCDIWGN